MKPLQYIAIFARLFALGLAAVGLKESILLIEAIYTGGINGMEVSLIYLSLASLAPLGVAALIWNFPLTVAGYIVPRDFDDQPESLSPSTTLYTIITGIGLFILCNSIADLVYWLTLYQLTPQTAYYENTGFKAELYTGIIATAFELFIGSVLIMQSKYIANKIVKVAV